MGPRTAKMRALTLLLLLGVAPGACAQDALRKYADGLRAEASALKPTAGEMRWQEIPWIVDLGVGLDLARKENRPLFLWTTGDEPLGRC